MAHAPLKMTVEEAHAEVKYGWEQAYSPETLAQAVDALTDQPLGYRIKRLPRASMLPRNISPYTGEMAWLKVVARNRWTILRLVRAFFGRRARPTNPDEKTVYEQIAVPDASAEVSA